MQEKCEVLVAGIAELEKTGSVFDVTNAFAAFAADVISQYSFGFSYGQVKRWEDGWAANYHKAYLAMGAFGHVAVQYPWVNPVSCGRFVLSCLC